ncbi:MAG: lipopolysaccharide biosynthesis protein [Kordiimonadaceae bacterium]|nr:lipopolysaccharide biosynthesis protein [Kordiimonadaceae bacterium]
MSKIKLSTLVLKGLSWNFSSRLLSNLSQLFIYFILARILQPADFGIMASLAVFINLSNMFATAGLGNANIQSKSLSAERFPTIFYLSLAISIMLYLIIYLSAPYLSGMLNISNDFVSLLRIYGLTILLTVINSIQMSELSRNLAFEKIFYCSTIPAIISGVVSIGLAYAGFGIYALIVNIGLAGILSIAFCAIYYSPIPRFSFNFEIAKKSLSYSGSLFFASLADEIYKSTITISIGKVYSASTLGYYNLGKQLPTFIASTINATIASVFFPVFSDLQNDLIAGKKMLRSSIRSLNILIFPVLCLTILLAEDVVSVLLTDKWLPSVIYIQYFAVIVGLHHIYANSSHFINALGYSFVTLRYALFNKLIGFIVLALTLNIGAIEIVVGQLLVVILSIIFNAVPNRKYIEYSFKEQTSDIVPALVINIFLYFVFAAINIEITNQLIRIILVTSAFLLAYLLMIFIFRLKVIDDWAKILRTS